MWRPPLTPVAARGLRIKGLQGSLPGARNNLLLHTNLQPLGARGGESRGGEVARHTTPPRRAALPPWPPPPGGRCASANR
jgi:hypothetical protein